LTGKSQANAASAVVDAALRESETAAAIAGLGVHLAESGGFLLGGKFGKIDARKFGGAFRIFQENLSAVLEVFDLAFTGMPSMAFSSRS